MTSTVTFTDFCDGFTGDYKNSFSYEGKRELFDYLESYESQTGKNIDFDPIALAVEYTEYDNLADFSKQFGSIFLTLSELEDETTVIECTNGHIIVADF